MAAEQYAEEHELDDLRREPGLDEPAVGQGVHDRAIKLLASQGRWTYSDDDYVEACLQVGAR